MNLSIRGYKCGAINKATKTPIAPNAIPPKMSKGKCTPIKILENPTKKASTNEIILSLYLLRKCNAKLKANILFVWSLGNEELRESETKSTPNPIAKGRGW